MQDPETQKFIIPREGKKDKNVKIIMPISNQNIHMYQEIIKIQVYKLHETKKAADFAIDDKTYIGEVHVMWKECPNKTGEEGASHMLDFTLEMSDPESQSGGLIDISGKLAGNLKWIKFGGKGSGFTAEGTRAKEKQAQ